MAHTSTTVLGVCLGYTKNYSGVLQVIDASIPEAPTLVGQFGTSDYAHSVHVEGSLAVVSYYNKVRHFNNLLDNYDRSAPKRIRLYDVSDPSAPTLLSVYSGFNMTDVDTPYQPFIHGTHVYVVADCFLSIVDITNPSAPSLVGSIELPVSSRHTVSDIHVEGQTAYVAVSRLGLLIFDVSDQSAAKLVGSFDASDIHTVTVVGTTAYIGDGYNLLTVDVSSPASPKLLGTLREIKKYLNTIKDVCVRGTVAYFAQQYGLWT